MIADSPISASIDPPVGEIAVLSRWIQDGFEATPIGLVVLDHGLRVAGFNPAGWDALGMRVGESLCERLLVSLPAGLGRNWSADLARVLAGGGMLHCPNERFGAGGKSQRVLDLSFAAIPNAAGQGCGVLVLVQDMSAHADLERRLATAESLAAVGKLAARVAHELNNPLDGALRYLNLAARRLQGAGKTPPEPMSEADKQIVGYLDQARQGLLRMARIIGDLLEFSRSAPQLRDEGNINAVVDEAIRALSMSADEAGVAITAAYHDDAAMPALDGTRLFQVCCNIIRNAIDAMPEGGMLTISTGMVNADAVIRFEDTGAGVPVDAQKIFEPFYTTKTGKGTGLGLAICKEYVEKLGGAITAERGKQKGSVFTLRIPASSCKPTGRQTKTV
jgi:signal transduction histidine kinase